MIKDAQAPHTVANEINFGRAGRVVPNEVNFGRAGRVVPNEINFGRSPTWRAAPELYAGGRVSRTEFIGRRLPDPITGAQHHNISMFMGGATDQPLTYLPRQVHIEFHQELSAALRTRGLPPMGGRTGSSQAWRELMSSHPGAQQQAFDAVIEASRRIDARHGTTITQDFWENIMSGRFKAYP